MMTTTRLFRDYAKGETNSFDCVTTDWYCPVISHCDTGAALGRGNVSAWVRTFVSSPVKFSRDAAALSALRDRLADAIEASSRR
jgi:hypothetical protein